MRLGQLLEEVPGIIATAGDLDTDVASITSDSRQVAPGVLFVAYRGVGADGHRYIPDAIRRGAVAVVGEQPAQEANADAQLPVPYVHVEDGRAVLAWLNAAWYGHPSRSMTVIGVTGTDGKTTTCNILFSILRAAGIKAGMISTVNAVIGDRTYDTGLHTTTPDSADVQRYLAQMRSAGTEVVVLETTSHGLAQHRVTGVDYDIAVITNITHEHLDFHGSYDAYRDAKAMLFRSLLALAPVNKPGFSQKPGLFRVPKTAVLNADDSSSAFLTQIPAERYVFYSVENRRPGSLQHAAIPVTLLRSEGLQLGPSGMSFDLEVAGSKAHSAPISIVTRLIGRFNVSNVLAAAGAATALGLGPADISHGVSALAAVPGRMERVDRGQNFTAIVDFAHTPNALAAALTTARDLAAADHRVIAVFGSAGLRDREKRRLMGEVAARAADYTVITAEDPRTEDLYAILDETAGAMAQTGRVEGRDFVRIPDRQRAIMTGVRSATAGDVLLVCGKGHEQSMCFGVVEHPWRDQDALAWALDEMLGRGRSDPPFTLPTWFSR